MQKEKRIIFMSSFKGDFTSNSKYLFEDYIANNSYYQCKFVIRDAEERAKLTEEYGDYFISNNTLADKIYCLRSAVWVCSYFDMPVQGFGLAINRTVLHLGHGIPVKASGLLESKVSVLKRIYYYLNQSNFTYHFAPTEEVAKILSNMFGCPIKKFIYASQPRTDRIIELSRNDSITDSSRKVLYAPTWRYNEKPSFFKFDDLNLMELDCFLRQNNIFLYYRPHPLFLPEDQSFLSENIKLSTPVTEPEINDFLHTYDAIISDYSSIVIDYLILDRSIAIYDYDCEQYREENGFCYDFDEFCPGVRIRTQADLIEFLTDTQSSDDMRLKRKAISERFNGKMNNSVKVFKDEVLGQEYVK
ncbi:CDP-glycerol glycerophosphotransferase family protein [Vibrio sp. 10N.222.54.B12]|uniref:CDP-glycerol glycerophosphotransferase family protein n=1 Tax=unclassified Vibrio TaxID=2614977 RepID=UPI0010BD971E|nr:CDP-glycerol glycerophosphotransferase family protein [Vibrio sp. F13]TKF54507.1 hypothetical protein FCV60_09360 [Vibrio sp. F13]